MPSQDTLPEKGSNDNVTFTDPSSFACGHLLKKYDGGTTTFNLRGLNGALRREVELKAGAYEWVKDYIYRDGLLLASQHRTEGHQHYALSHLGTTRMLTNRCGERVKRYELFPYGDTISAPANDTETRRFTGHQRDLGSPTNTTDDLEYMHARYYGVKMGRFVSVDAGTAKRGLPQSWNRYAYVTGNPVLRFDPDGLAEQLAVFVTFRPGDSDNEYDLTSLRRELSEANSKGKFHREILVFANGTLSPPTVEAFEASLHMPDRITVFLGHGSLAGLGPFESDRFTKLEGVENRNSLVILAGCDTTSFVSAIARPPGTNQLVVAFSGEVFSKKVASFIATFFKLLKKGRAYTTALELAVKQWEWTKQDGLNFRAFGDCEAVFAADRSPFPGRSRP